VPSPPAQIDYSEPAAPRRDAVVPMTPAPEGSLRPQNPASIHLRSVIPMWKLLGELAVQYCKLAAWALAAGYRDRATAQIEKAGSCLVQRGRHKGREEIGLTDVLGER
jgi:hypothetical protein